jgi:hypothetical protein
MRVERSIVPVLRAAVIGLVVGALGCPLLVAVILIAVGEVAMLLYVTYLPTFLVVFGATVGCLVGGELEVTWLITRSRNLGWASRITESAGWECCWGLLYGASMAAYGVTLFFYYYIGEVTLLWLLGCCLIGSCIGLAVAFSVRVSRSLSRNEGED